MKMVGDDDDIEVSSDDDEEDKHIDSEDAVRSYSGIDASDNAREAQHRPPDMLPATATPSKQQHPNQSINQSISQSLRPFLSAVM
jgi:hypothetical protein